MIRYFQDMRRPLDEPIPDATLDAHLTLAPWTEERDEAVRLAHNEAFIDHCGSEPLPAETWRHRWTGSPWFRPDLTWIVLDREVVAGYCLSYHSPIDAAATGRREGWCDRRPPTVAEAGDRERADLSGDACLKDAGLEYAALDVDSENPTGAAGPPASPSVGRE